MRILPISYGRSRLPESMVFPGGSPKVLFPIDFKVFLVDGDILVDAGCQTMPGFVMEDFVGSVQALKNVGIDPDRIKHVLLTHAHHDHIECVKYFPNALIHISSEAYEKGKKYIPEGFRINVFEREYQICPGVRAVRIGGHAKGSCVVEVTEDNTVSVIAGDECYLRANLEQKIPTASSYDPEKSRRFIEKYTQPGYSILLSHDE